ncbi:hypothetical protein ASPZODRAFT_22693 [Penicilliopsis zonata CBS 506.65]|uniref:Phytanoyl-CoA dioxygenase n=1 Tax=Penicilliopsis zonata CBS 506.65 TaxID=1073090 RepID=A0A1L9SS09_9EURO|nr:hypothetical protein ASPZODRAFT_22693 [Penicilliopsis zonata CBS 506.65]OJJ49992.1 hypothetical protein ASPZODRAFT_22693 [Penicilliopsis zonata CBS 506.65]
MYKPKVFNAVLEGFFPAKSERVYGLLGKMPNQIVQIMRLPVWQKIMEHFLQKPFKFYVGEKLVENLSGYTLSTSAMLRLVPGAERQPLHRDGIPWQAGPNLEDPLDTPMVGCLIAGSKCTYKNGATLVIPGSHKWPVDRVPKLEECAIAEMEPGSALFTLGTTYHAGGENKCTSEDPEAIRALFAVFGQRDYLRRNQEEVLSTPAEIACELPDDILRLTGYYKSVGSIGHIEHRNPIEFIRDGMSLGKVPTRLNYLAGKRGMCLLPE